MTRPTTLAVTVLGVLASIWAAWVLGEELGSLLIGIVLVGIVPLPLAPLALRNPRRRAGGGARAIPR